MSFNHRDFKIKVKMTPSDSAAQGLFLDLSKRYCIFWINMPDIVLLSVHTVFPEDRCIYKLCLEADTGRRRCRSLGQARTRALDRRTGRRLWRWWWWWWWGGSWWWWLGSLDTGLTLITSSLAPVTLLEPVMVTSQSEASAGPWRPMRSRDWERDLWPGQSVVLHTLSHNAVNLRVSVIRRW